MRVVKRCFVLLIKKQKRQTFRLRRGGGGEVVSYFPETLQRLRIRKNNHSEDGEEKQIILKIKLEVNITLTPTSYPRKLLCKCDSLQQNVPLVGLHWCLIHEHYKPTDNQYLKRIINLWPVHSTTG